MEFDNKMIGVIVPMKLEYDAIPKEILDDKSLIVAMSGIGKIRVLMCCYEMLICHPSISHIILTGYAGGLSGVEIGQSVQGNHVVEGDYDDGGLDATNHDLDIDQIGIDATPCKVYSQDTFLIKDPYDAYGNCITDMESYSVALFCKRYGMKFSVVKVVSDIVGDNSSKKFVDNTNFLSGTFSSLIAKTVAEVKREISKEANSN